MLKHTAKLFTFFIFILFFISCDDDNPTGPESGTSTLTMTHYGVDWSEGIAGSETVTVDNPDGETIAWCPTSNSGWLTGIWYRSAKDHFYRVGTGDLSDITGVDTTQWATDVCDTPLKNGDLWVAEALDGYVAFKVLDAPMDSTSIANSPFWSVEVEYKFSNTLGF